MRVTVLVLIAFVALQVAGYAADQVLTNEMCPVLRGNRVDPNVYVDYKGKRVYFCCTDCQAAFLANPEPYLQYLPQFASTTAQPEGQPAGATRQGEARGLSPSAVQAAEAPKPAPRAAITRLSLIKPMGITTFSLLLATVGAGVFMRHNPRFFLKLQTRLAVVTLVSACTHAFLVLFH